MAGGRTNSQQTARTTVKGGSGPATAARPAASTRAETVAMAPTAARKPRGKGPARGERAKAAPGHKREMVALVLVAVAVFLFVVLLSGGAGGVLGRGSAAGLGFAFGNVALVVPIALLVIAVTTVLEVRVRRSYVFAGALVFVFGLFLLIAAGVPPFGGHSADNFVRAEFEGRSGGLGEAVYALLHGLAGTVGVAIIGWVAVVAGFSLATGMTVGRLATGTKRAAGTVRDTAERGRTAVKNRDAGEPDLAAAGLFPGVAATAWQGSSPTSTTSGTRLGPVDLVGGDFGSTQSGAGGVTAGNPFGQEFEDWSDGRPAVRSPLALEVSGSGGGVLDGAHAFADLYGPSVVEGAAAAAAGGAANIAGNAAGAAGAVAAAGVGGVIGAAGGAATVSGSPGAAAENAAADDPLEAGQETLPGLGRTIRQTALPVEQPAYLLPEAELLRKSTPLAPGRANERDTAGVVLEALGQFGVEARVVGMVVGPRVTRYELQLAPGTKVSKVSSLKDDLAYALATTEIRILAPIPGKSAVGVEVPNQRPDFVTLGDIYREFPKSAGPLMVWLGKDISGKPVYTDLARLPHLLIAGTTGSGKSGCVNCIVSSILLRSTPEQVRLIMIDPKKVELSHYDRIPHLLVPVVTNMKDAAGVLHNVAKEMEDRYELMELEHSRSLGDITRPGRGAASGRCRTS